MDPSDIISKDSFETISQKLPQHMESKLLANIFFTVQNNVKDHFCSEVEHFEMKSEDRAYLNQKVNEENNRIDLKNSKTSLLSNLSMRSKSLVKEQEAGAKKKKKKIPKIIEVLFLFKSVLIYALRFRNNNQYRPIKLANAEHINQINDVASSKYETNKIHNYTVTTFRYRKKLLKITNFIRKTKIFRFLVFVFGHVEKLFIEYLFTIYPDNKFKILWDFFIILIILILFFAYPVQISFQMKSIFYEGLQTSKDYFIDIWINLFIIIDIIVKLMTAYYDKGLLITDKRAIIQNYFHNHLIYDLTSYLPIFIQSSLKFNPDNQSLQNVFFFIQPLVFIKIFDLAKLLQILEEILQLNEKSLAFFQIIQLILKILLFYHILACIWNGISYYSSDENNMQKFKGFYYQDWLTRYCRCLFMSINPGKIDPQNNVEQFLGFFTLLATTCSVGFMVSSIHNIMRVVGKSSEQHSEDMRILNRFLQRNKIEFDLKNKVRKYFEIRKDENLATVEKEMKLIDKLNKSMKDEILIKGSGHVLRRFDLFTNNFSEKTQEELILKLKRIRFSPEEYIFHENVEEKDPSIYFLEEGEVLLCKEKNFHAPISKLKCGNYFGEIAFFANERPKFSAISSKFSTIYALRKSDFLSVLKENNKDHEKYCMLKDQIKHNKKQKILTQYCDNCCIRGHHVLNCMKMHFIPNEDFLIRKLNFSESHFDRTFVKRTEKRRKNAKLSKKNLELLSKQLDFKQMMSFTDRYPSDESEGDNETGRASEPLKIEKQGIINSLKSEETVFSPDSVLYRRRSSKLIALTAIKPPDFFMMDFEKHCNFEGYFPEKNLESILMKLENMRRRFPGKGRFKKRKMN